MSGPLSDEAEQEFARKQVELAQMQRDDDMRAVMSTESGRRVVWRLIDDMAGVFGGSFTGDTKMGDYNEGRRSIGIELMLEVQRVSRRNYVEMVSDAVELEPEPLQENSKP